MIRIDSLAEKIFGLLKGNKFPVKMFTVDGNETVDSSEARRFFSETPGIMVTIDEENEEIQLNKKKEATLDVTRGLQRNLKELANEYLLNYMVRNFNKGIAPKDFSYQAKVHRMKQMENVKEGFSKLAGSKKTSQQTLENVKILVKHRQAVEEEKHGARSRNIQAIFLEQNGERLRFPHNNLRGARAMARHMSCGGGMSDTVGSYIIEKTDQMIRLNEFFKYARSNRLISEDTDDVISVVRENYANLQSELQRLSGVKTYATIKSRIEESEEMVVVEDDVTGLRDQFTVKKFDERFNDVLPLVNRLVQEKAQFLNRIEESSTGEIYISPETYSIASILEFASKRARMGHTISEMAHRIIENPELSTYIASLGKKMCNETELNSFESNIVQNFVNNVKPQPLAETEAVVDKSDIQESLNYGEFFDKYSYTFL